MRKSLVIRLGFQIAAAALFAAAASSAHAQVATTAFAPAAVPAWNFAVTPYAWLPTLSTSVSYTGPRGNTVSSEASAGVGDYISDLNFALMVGGEARYDRFTIMTDLVYSNASLTSSTTHFSSVNVGSGPIYIPREQQVSTGTRSSATIWSLAGGYTLLNGDWGNIDAVAGLRMLFLSSSTNYSLTNDILLPNQTVALSRGGSLSFSATKPEGVGGVTGRINVPNSHFYLSFYLDAGGGAVPFTWQAYAGVAYQAASWSDLSVGYRYLSFQGGSKNGVQNMSLGGAILAANFHF